MERDFLGLGSKLSPITVNEETNQDSVPSRGLKEWSFSSKVSSTPQFLSFGKSQQDRLINSVNSEAFTPTSVVDQNRRTHYSSLQEVRMFPISSQHDQATITASMSELGAKSFININNQPLGGSPIMSSPVSVFPAPTNIRSSSKPPPAQLTIFYAGSVSVYKDISPDKAQAIMLLAGNGPQAKPVSMPKSQKPVHHSPTTTYPPTTMPHIFVPSIYYNVSETGSGSNGVTAASLASTRNIQNNAFSMAPAVCLPQSRKASLARFLEKRKERIINVSPYYVNNKSIECRTPMSECVSSPLSSSSAIRPI